MHSLQRILEDLRHPTALLIGTTVTIGYGTLYYAIAVFAPIVTQSFGIGLDLFFGILAAGLFIGGLAAPLIGKHIDKHGAGSVLTFGSGLAAASFVLMGAAPNIWIFGTALILMEIAGAMVLYEAAFAGLTQKFDHKARRYISAVTLIGGFASTIFWPMTQFLVDAIDWRATYFLFAGLHLLICLPLNGIAFKNIRPRTPAQAEHIPEEANPVLKGAARQRAILLFAAAICISGAVFAVMPVHILLILQHEGMLASTAALVVMVIGPAQVIARLVEMGLESKYSALATGRVCLTALPLALLFLIVFQAGVWNAIPFALFYGIAQGLANIMRGTVPLQLFGARGYGALNGKITSIRFALTAGAPFAFAILMSQAGLQTALWLSFSLAASACAAFWMLQAPNNLPNSIDRTSSKAPAA